MSPKACRPSSTTVLAAYRTIAGLIARLGVDPDLTVLHVLTTAERSFRHHLLDLPQPEPLRAPTRFDTWPATDLDDRWPHDPRCSAHNGVGPFESVVDWCIGVTGHDGDHRDGMGRSWSE